MNKCCKRNCFYFYNSFFKIAYPYRILTRNSNNGKHQSLIKVDITIETFNISKHQKIINHANAILCIYEGNAIVIMENRFEKICQHISRNQQSWLSHNYQQSVCFGGRTCAVVVLSRVFKVIQLLLPHCARPGV